MELLRFISDIYLRGISEKTNRTDRVLLDTSQGNLISFSKQINYTVRSNTKY